MDAETIKQWIIDATGATDVEVLTNVWPSDCLVKFTSLRYGSAVMPGVLERAGFGVDDVRYLTQGRWHAYLNDTSPAPGAPAFTVGQRVVATRDITDVMEYLGEDEPGSTVTVLKGVGGEVTRIYDKMPSMKYLVYFLSGDDVRCKAEWLALAPQPGDALPASDPAGDCGADTAPAVTAAYDDDEPMTYERPGFVHCAYCTQHLQADVAYKGDDGKMYCSAVCELEARHAELHNAINAAIKEVAEYQALWSQSVAASEIPHLKAYRHGKADAAEYLLVVLKRMLVEV